MRYCESCGNCIGENALFCSNCGKKVKTEQDKITNKCPNCGGIYNAYTVKCDYCDYEFRNVGVSSSIRAFEKQLKAIEDKYATRQPKGVYQYTYRYATIGQKAAESVAEKIKKEKISLISNFPVPNSKEDILEFMILASSNFDSQYYLSHLQEEDISDAWLAKIKQCYLKAKLVLVNDSSLLEVTKIYNSILNKISMLERF